MATWAAPRASRSPLVVRPCYRPDAAGVARLLIAAKADVNAKDNSGDTALMWAAFENVTDVARLLKAAGAR